MTAKPKSDLTIGKLTPDQLAKLEATPAGRAMIMGRQEAVDALMRESPLQNEQAKAMLCESVVILRQHMRLLLEKQRAGTITADESRAVASMAQAMRRTMLDLKIDEKKTKDKPHDFNY